MDEYEPIHPNRPSSRVLRRLVKKQSEQPIQVNFTNGNGKPGFWLRTIVIQLLFNFFGIWGMVPVVMGGILYYGFGWNVQAPGNTKPSFTKQIGNEINEGLDRREEARARRKREEEQKKAEADRIRREAEAAAAKAKDEEERKTLTGIARSYNLELDPAMTTGNMRFVVEKAKEFRADFELRESLYARAKGMGVPYRESATTERLKAGLDEAERAIKRHNAAQANYEAAHAKWEAIPYNARCPRCRHPYHSRANPKNNVMCRSCQWVFTARTGYSLWQSPPEPQPPAPLNFVEIM